MAPKSLSLLVLLCSILLAVSSTEASLGGWQTISNLTDPKVVEVVHFALEEHNKKLTAMLELVSVLKGKTQIVDGINYMLVISAKDALATSNYLVLVWDNPLKKERKLTSFKKLYRS